MDPLFLVVALVVIVVVVFLGRRTQRRAPVVMGGALPDRFPLKTKGYFFSRSESALYSALTTALEGTPYRVFPNVRLNDVFLIEAQGTERASTLGRLRDKHVDFLIVEGANFRPVLGIELDGASHRSERQQARDAVKNLAFKSAGLPLVRLDAARSHTSPALRELVQTNAKR